MMVLADTSVWIDHLNGTDPGMTALLNQRMIWMHPLVAGELSLGSLRNRASTLRNLDLLPHVQTAGSSEVRHMIERHGLHSGGIGWIDASLLASVALNNPLKLWSRDKPLRRIAEALGLHATLG